jgi:uncharacterized protein (TIGR00369 family)
VNRLGEHECFGCGEHNPIGLRLVFAADGPDGVVAHFTPGRSRQGWIGATHGGILATLLDEALAWALVRAGIWAVTARLSITYRRPVPLSQPLTVHGRLVRDRGRLVEAAGEVRDAAGRRLVEAEGHFYCLPAPERSRLERLYGLPESASGEAGP